MDGPVVLRLRAELWDGRTVDEYTVFSFESNQPLRLSTGTSDEQEPSISGNTVVWRGPGTSADRRDAIWIGGVDRHSRPMRPRLLHQSDRVQRRAIVSAGRVVWIENDPEREVVLIKVARVWRYLDEAAAEDWLLKSSLSEEAREKVRAPIEK